MTNVSGRRNDASENPSANRVAEGFFYTDSDTGFVHGVGGQLGPSTGPSFVRESVVRRVFVASVSYIVGTLTRELSFSAVFTRQRLDVFE